MCAHTDTHIYSPVHSDQNSCWSNSVKPTLIRSCCFSPWNFPKTPLLKVKAKVFTVAHEAPMICPTCPLPISVTYVPPHTSYSTPASPHQACFYFTDFVLAVPSTWMECSLSEWLFPGYMNWQSLPPHSSSPFSCFTPLTS